MQVTFNIYNGLVYSQAAQVLNLSTTSIEKKIREIETLTYNIATDSNIQENANMMMHASSDYNRSEHLSKLLEQLVTYSFQDNNIQSVSFVDTQNRQYNRGASPFGIDEKVKNFVIEKAVAAEGKSVILKPPDDENCIMIARIIRKIHALSLEYMGTVIIRYDIGDIANEYLSSSKDNEPILAIISEEGLIFSSKELSDNEIDMMTFKSDSGYEIKKINGEKLFWRITSRTIPVGHMSVLFRMIRFLKV
ncbi:cache domain-containing protein [Thermoclostridium stercorarium]|uniref:cache domain-containing protein n=1 Tax=Thermoclostridium stercorarium TaxID=1510 RepID=UPI00224914C4|nr:cache domain-containing protein [Thermoclostridium stercorarium]UZQ85166.1 cache domain-containing protein [Thermoclostridium stercorarium]